MALKVASTKGLYSVNPGDMTWESKWNSGRLDAAPSSAAVLNLATPFEETRLTLEKAWRAIDTIFERIAAARAASSSSSSTTTATSSTRHSTRPTSIGSEDGADVENIEEVDDEQEEQEHEDDDDDC